MYCNNCGKEIDDKAVVCIHCGVATPISAVKSEEEKKNERPNSGLMVLSFFVPIAGFIIGGIEKSNGKHKAGNSYIRMGVLSLILWIVICIAYYFIVLATVEESIDTAVEETNNYVSDYYDKVDKYYDNMFN